MSVSTHAFDILSAYERRPGLTEIGGLIDIGIEVPDELCVRGGDTAVPALADEFARIAEERDEGLRLRPHDQRSRRG